MCWPRWSSRRPGVATSTSTPRGQHLHLRAVLHPAEDGGDREAQVLAIGAEALGDLAGQLAGRRQHEHSGAAPGRGLPGGVQPVQDRQGEGGGLAGARLGDAEKVPPGHDGGNGLGLDGGGCLVALALQRLEQEGIQAKFGEGGSFGEGRFRVRARAARPLERCERARVLREPARSAGERPACLGELCGRVRALNRRTGLGPVPTRLGAPIMRRLGPRISTMSTLQCEKSSFTAMGAPSRPWRQLPGRPSPGGNCAGYSSSPVNPIALARAVKRSISP